MFKDKKVVLINLALFLLTFSIDICFIMLGTPYIYKTIASVLFVITGIVNLIFVWKMEQRNKWFKYIMLAGLIFACLGDIVLIDYFIYGAILFAIGHVFFFASYCLLEKICWRDLFISVVIFGVSLIVILVPKIFTFGNMLPIVVIYALIISFMLGKSVSNLFVKKYQGGNFLIMLGSLLFFLSDLMLLFNVFADVSRAFDIACLILYYPAEIILATSIYYSNIKIEEKMPFFKRVYCRVFQVCFRAMIPFMPYRQPKILEGMDDIVAVLKEKNIKSLFLATDKQIRGLGLTKELEDKVQNAGIKLTVFDDVLPNPTISMVEKALEIYNKNECEALVAFGGGSVMDLGKVVLARKVKPNESVSKMKGLLKICKKLPPLFAVPTTAGTGSETTLAAVITDDKTHYKYAINDFSLIPHYAVLDYKVTLNLPPFVTATTGMDALTHAVEAYIGRSTTKLTRKMAEDAVKLIVNNLQTAYDEPHNEKARQNMLKASYCAGVAFTISYVGYVHAIAHSLGGQYGVAHGLANAVILPHMLKVYGDSIYKKLSKLAKISGVASENDNIQVASDKFIKFIENLNKHFDIPKDIKELKEEDFEILASHAESEGNPLYPVPVLMDKDALIECYKLLIKNK